MLGKFARTLRDDFAAGPPFTLQRLAELLAEPNALYSPSEVYKYLLAIRRVLSVSSTTSQYPEDALREELKRSKSQPENAPEGGVHLTKISWVVDTGTPPPSSLDDDDDEPENDDANGEPQPKHARVERTEPQAEPESDRNGHNNSSAD